MPSFNSFLKDPQAAKLMGDSTKLEQLKGAPETQKIFAMLNRSTGGNLEQAAGDAANGDSEQLIAAIRQLLSDPEGAQLIQKMKDRLK